MNKVAILSSAVLLAALLMLASNAQSAGAEAYFNDDFSDPNSSNWSMIRGTWFESGGEYSTSAGNSISIADGINVTDCAIETSLRFNAPINLRAGIVFRYSTALSYYSFEIGNQFNEIAIVRYSPVSPIYGETGAFIRPSFENSSLTIDPNAMYILRLEIQGTRYDAFINEQKVLSWNDDAYSSGAVGLRASSADVSFDYVRIFPLTPTATATPSPAASDAPTPSSSFSATSSPAPSTPTYSPTPLASLQPTSTPTATISLTSTPQPSLTESPTSGIEETLTPSPSIPEFPSETLPMAIIAITALVAILGKRIRTDVPSLKT
jgi:hypothetical protein